MVTETRANNFDLLRLLCALVVLLNHSYSLVGLPVQDGLFQLTGTTASGTFALAMFLVISGYLINQSYWNRPSALSFFSARILRIFPAYLVSILAAVFLLGPICTDLSLSDYFQQSATWKFLLNGSLYKLQFHLPGVFTASYFHSSSINGSIWSLSYEFTLYIVLFFLAKSGLFKKKLPNAVIAVLVISMLIALDQVKSINHLHFAGIEAGKIINMSVFFFLGVALAILKDKITINTIGFVLFSAFFIGSCWLGINDYVLFFYVPYCTLYLAYLKLPFLKWLTVKGDLSYGIYVYGFMIQQAIVYAFKGNLTVRALLLYSVPISLIVAFASWHLIEKRALKWKRYF